MLDKPRTWVIGIASILFLAWVLLGEPQGEICEENKYQNTKDCTHYKGFAFLFIKVLHAFNHNEGAVLGLGTLFLALFTFALWRATSGLKDSTEKLWTEATAASKISKQSADAAFTQAESIKSSERARVFVKVTLEKITRDTPHPFGPMPEVKIRATNHGKTVAIITGVRAHIFASGTVPTDLPPDRNEPHPILDGLAVAPSDEYVFWPQYELHTFHLDNERNFDIAWYCAGEFSYKDIFGEVRTTGFCWICRPFDGSGFRFCMESPLNRQT